jgi:hypothetical protein
VGLAVAVPGAARYLSAAMASGDQRQRDQRVLAAALPEEAVVFGAYAPTLLFDTRAELLTLWPSAGANSRDPVGRFGATHVLAAAPEDTSDPTLRLPALARLRHTPGIVSVRWDDHTLQLHALDQEGRPP